MKRTLGLLTPLLLTAGVAVTAPPAAHAAPLPSPYSASATGRVADVDLDLLTGIDLADVGLAPSVATVDSSKTPPVVSESRNLAATVAGLGVAVASNRVTAPPDAGPTTGSLVGFDLLGIRLGALTTTNEAHYSGAATCVPGGLLSSARTQTTGVRVAPAGLLQVLDTGVSSTTGRTELVSTGGNGLNKKVVSTTVGSEIASASVLGGAVNVGVVGDSTLTATATGKTGGAGVTYAPGTVRVTVGSTTTTLAAGASRTIDVGTLGATGQVVVTANQPTRTVDPDGLSARGEVSVVTLDVRVGGSALPLANATIDLLPLSAAAEAPTGGIDCAPAAPVLTTPANGSTTADTTPTFSGTGVPGASVAVTVGGTVTSNAATVGTDGSWSYTPTNPLPLGSNTASATQTVNGAVSVVSNSNTFTIRAATAVALTSSAASVRFGVPVVLTANLDPSSARGTVTFTDTASSGPDSGQPVALGDATVNSSGVATLSTRLPAFGANTIVARYAGNATHAAATSPAVVVQVNAYEGELLITELRTSGPGGAADSFVELKNTGPTMPLAGFTVRSGSGTSIVLPDDAPSLGTNRHYLVTGTGFSLDEMTTPDQRVASLGTGGHEVLAPDSGRTRTDAVGPSSGAHRGSGLAVLTGTPTAQHAWVRLQKAGRPVDTGQNAADFALVSVDGGVVGGAQSMVGSPLPTGRADLHQYNEQLKSYLLNPNGTAEAAPNRVSVVGTPGELVVRRTITNTSLTTVTGAQARITSLSEANGVPHPDGLTPARVALIRAVDPDTSTSLVTVAGRGPVTVRNLAVDAPNSGQPGGGLNSTLTIPLPAGGLQPGASVDVAFTFDVDTRGTFWFGYDVEALATVPIEIGVGSSRTAAPSGTTLRKAAQKTAELTRARDRRIAELGPLAKHRTVTQIASGTL